MLAALTGQAMKRLDYSAIRSRAAAVKPASFASFVRKELPRLLTDLWCEEYLAEFSDAEIVVVNLDNFTYLFDLKDERNLAVYAIMGGKNTIERDHARMAGHPKAEGRDFHRGHMIPHSGHGGTDINLFVQRGSVNIGPFRPLERLAVDNKNKGSFYFVRLLYRMGSHSQRPISMEQGLLLKANPPDLDVRFFVN